MKAKKNNTRPANESQEQVEAEAHANAAEIREAMNALVKAAVDGDHEAEKIFWELSDMVHKMFARMKAQQSSKPSAKRPRRVQGVITQAELQKFFEAHKAWERDENESEFPPALAEESRIRNQKLKAGWEVEPGRFRFELHAGGRYCVIDDGPTPAKAPHARRPDTPSPDELQRWFDLPSEPRS
jgi:hypothetical protein